MTYPPPKKNIPTPYEKRAVRAVHKYGTVKAAAEALFVSRHTIDNQLDRLREKSGVRYFYQLVQWAAEQGWLYESEEATEK